MPKQLSEQMGKKKHKTTSQNYLHDSKNQFEGDSLQIQTGKSALWRENKN